MFVGPATGSLSRQDPSEWSATTVANVVLSDRSAVLSSCCHVLAPLKLCPNLYVDCNNFTRAHRLLPTVHQAWFKDPCDVLLLESSLTH